MKLTKYHRDAMLKAIMNDVPKIDFQDRLETLVIKDSIDQAEKISPHLAALIADPALRVFAIDRYNGRVDFDRRYSSGLSGAISYSGYKPSIECEVAAQAIVEAARAQKEALDALANKVSSALASCPTSKAVMDRLPEFVKYLPVESEKAAGVPALINPAADLIAAGWPKGKAEVEEEAVAA